MSLHAQLSPEAKARLAAQKRNSTISSIIISMLLILLVGVVLTLLLLPKVDNFTPEIVSYSSGTDDKEKIVKKQINRKVQPKPSSPSSSMAKVIAANVTANVAVPVPDTPVDIPLDFGNGDGVGDGWGDGEGWGDGGGGAEFFGQKVTANRVCYVIDYSASMRGRRIELLKKELTKSIKNISPEVQYQLIFFAGPAWLAGDEVVMNGREGAEVKSGKETYKWSSPKKSANSWKTSGKRQPVPWLEASSKQIYRSLKAVKDTPLVWGTAWEDPLEMALKMEPAPQVIFFMTDGLAGGGSDAVAKKVAARAKAKGIQINTVAMMEPRAEAAMKTLSKNHDGSFTLIKEDGEAVKK